MIVKSEKVKTACEKMEADLAAARLRLVALSNDIADPRVAAEIESAADAAINVPLKFVKELFNG